jgi:DNA repair protein RadC
MKTYQENTPEITLKMNKTDFPKVKITGSKDAIGFIRQFYSDDLEIYESFFILLLNRANSTIGYAKISQGGLAGTVVDPIIVAKYAIDSLSKSVILCHNHPSGNTMPSDADKQITNKIKNTLTLFDCTVLDHIILASDSYYSFSDECIL